MNREELPSTSVHKKNKVIFPLSVTRNSKGISSIARNQFTRIYMHTQYTVHRDAIQNVNRKIETTICQLLRRFRIWLPLDIKIIICHLEICLHINHRLVRSNSYRLLRNSALNCFDCCSDNSMSVIPFNPFEFVYLFCIRSALLISVFLSVIIIVDSVMQLGN